jgi:hypothetical protein
VQKKIQKKLNINIKIKKYFLLKLNKKQNQINNNENKKLFIKLEIMIS